MPTLSNAEAVCNLKAARTSGHLLRLKFVRKRLLVLRLDGVEALHYGLQALDLLAKQRCLQGPLRGTSVTHRGCG